MVDNQNRNIEENNAWNHLSKWDTIVDERFRKLIGDGNMSWHPGAGKPLKLEDDSYVPEHERLAYKVMKDNDAVPTWMSLAFTLRDKHEKIVKQVTQFAHDYVRRSREALKSGSFLREQQAHDRWLEACRRLREDVARYNSELLNYNLQVPPSIPQMIPLNSDDLIAGALRQAERGYANNQ